MAVRHPVSVTTITGSLLQLEKLDRTSVGNKTQWYRNSRYHTLRSYKLTQLGPVHHRNLFEGRRVHNAERQMMSGDAQKLYYFDASQLSANSSTVRLCRAGAKQRTTLSVAGSWEPQSKTLGPFILICRGRRHRILMPCEDRNAFKPPLGSDATLMRARTS